MILDPFYFQGLADENESVREAALGVGHILVDHYATTVEHIRVQDEEMSMIVRALAMSGLQILMPTHDLAPPSTSEPLCPADTQ
ncbi:hypothetical protein C1H46_003524 [Malus baccata]|uniref:Condensin complex subunit 1 C-terminal domain-containing protein n=1 Tax=Malus baccata TaxID=106549 RepID=A0A540NIG7_MALBA|nr:hypothetical protein C1H46_003524 [Malus baccata]